MKRVYALLAAFSLLALVLFLRLEAATQDDKQYRAGTFAVNMARGYAK
jgi:hypothetical protein